MTEINYCPYCGKKLPLREDVEKKLDPIEIRHAEMRKIQEIRDVLKKYAILIAEDALQSTVRDYTEEIIAELAGLKK